MVKANEACPSSGICAVPVHCVHDNTATAVFLGSLDSGQRCEGRMSHSDIKQLVFPC